jgi:hypothetical protein
MKNFLKDLPEAVLQLALFFFNVGGMYLKNNNRSTAQKINKRIT